MEAKRRTGFWGALAWAVVLALAGMAVVAGVSSGSPGRGHASSAYYSTSSPGFVAENGSYYGEISRNTGRPKTVHVKGHYRKDGVYVRGHYRSKPRR